MIEMLVGMPKYSRVLTLCLLPRCLEPEDDVEINFVVHAEQSRERGLCKSECRKGEIRGRAAGGAILVKSGDSLPRNRRRRTVNG
jgi:hypothetical protein